MTRFLTLTAFVLTFAFPALAEPVAYALDRSQSKVAFTYDLSGSTTSGSMPVVAADVVVDLDRLSNSRVSATVSAAGATAGVFFATEAMRGRSVLNTIEHPEITFVSTRVRPKGSGVRADIDGNITIRGVTRPITLDAGLFRQAGTEVGDRRRLAIILTGSVDRNDFGASGFPDIVGDRINLEIRTFIDRIE